MSNPVLDQDRTTFLKARQRIGAVVVPAWPRQTKELPLVEVEVTWVRLSTLNHRTRAEQMREMHVSGNPTLFSADPLGATAQVAQYKILRSQEGFEALKADLKDRGQQEPAIVTADGVLINGNRRTAALRSLYKDDSYLKAQYVKCLVLPDDATPAELLDLEAELQVARDFKEEYSWINEALLIEELYERENRDFERVARRMHRQTSEVKSLYEKLQQVHQLVALANGARLHIDFKENESAFDELSKHIRNKPASEADSVRDAYFLGTLANVNYRKLRHLRRADASLMVMAEIQKEPALKPLLETIAKQTPATVDALDDVLGGPPQHTGLGSVLSLLATKRPEETITFKDGESVAVEQLLDSLQSAVNAAAGEAEEEERDQTAVVAPIVRAEKALVELERAVVALARARTYKEFDEAALADKVTKLQTLVSQLQPTS